MTQVLDIITQALRETNIIAITANPTPAETAEGLARLQAVILSVLGNEVGYIMEDWDVTATSITRPSGYELPSLVGFTVQPQSRLIANLAGDLSLNLDPQPQDGQRVSVVDANLTMASNTLTLQGNGRLIEGGTSFVCNTNGFAKQWLYRSDMASWVPIDPIAVDDDMPFPADFDDFFIIMLAMRINPRYGRELTAESQARLEQQRTQFILRYAQSRLRNNPAGNPPEKR